MKKEVIKRLGYTQQQYEDFLMTLWLTGVVIKLRAAKACKGGDLSPTLPSGGFVVVRHSREFIYENRLTRDLSRMNRPRGHCITLT